MIEKHAMLYVMVENRDREPLSGVEVFLTSQSGVTRMALTAGRAAGNYVSEAVDPGDYSLTVAVMRWVPTGGINAANLADYLAFPPILACGGSWMVAPKLIDGGDFETVARLSREAVALVEAVRSGKKAAT